MRTARNAVGALAVAAVVATTAISGGTATAAPGNNGKAVGKSKSDVRKVPGDYNKGKKLGLDKKNLKSVRKQVDDANRKASAARQADGDYEVGDSATFLALNDYTGGIYLKAYVLRGLGDKIEVWVPENTSFPDGDCRNTLGLTEITDAQIASFVSEFDNNIYPKESQSFSVPPERDGSNAALSEITGEDYSVSADQADNIVVLVDNVRDANYYEPSTPNGQTYIAGFFYSTFNEYIDRNIMTIDAFDWLHRTGANPPDNSTDADYVACSTALGQSARPLGVSRPRLYEGTFAHEYQHLLEYYEDPDEVSWVNEGLADYAQSLVGYVDTTTPPDAANADGHLKCFSGYQPPQFGGSENSLTLWEDQGGPEVLCDYGAAYSLMMYLFSHYGEDFMSAFHREDANGLEGLDIVLDQFGSTKSAMDTIHDWAAMAALDAALDKGRKLTGGSVDDFTSSSLSSKINWDTPQAYDTPGAPPNGSDYVRLRDASGNWLSAKNLKSISFSGATTLAPTPVEWTVDTTPPAGTTETMACGDVADGPAPAALYSGCGENLDRSIVRSVSVPAAGGNLTFDALWDIEVGWDFGFVQVSTDGGQTWTSLATEDTTSEHDPGAVAAVVDNLPGFTGDGGTWQSQSASLSAYAGQTILVGFRYITDPAANEAGFWVRNINAAGTALPSDSLEGWQTISQVNPQAVAGYTVQLIGYDAKGKSWIYRLPLDADFEGALSGAALNKALGKQATTVAAIVMQDDPTETVQGYAPYTLTVNGVVQPGG